MIIKVDHTNLANAENIWELFQASYSVEANLLKAVAFPPLKRSAEAISNSKTDFFGYYLCNQLTAILEIKNDVGSTQIQSLAVHPNYFRQRIGHKLVNFVLTNYTTEKFTVETGIGNAPAITLYKKHGFIETVQWNTDHGVRKVRLEKNKN